MKTDARRLRQLTELVAHEPVPELDWGRIEEQVLAKIEAEPEVRRLAPRVALWPRAVALAAAAAAITLGVLQVGPSSPFGFAPASTPQAAVPLASTGARLASGTLPLAADGSVDVLQLPVGATVQAQAKPLYFSYEPAARWSLAPGSQMQLVQRDRRLVLRLDAGQVSVEVQPSQGPDTFAVRVGNTEVSVHGTAFSVQRILDRVRVRVARGAVAVGAIGRFGVSSTGWLVVGPSQGSFSLDGARSAQFEPLSEEPLDTPRPLAEAPAASGSAASPLSSASERTASSSFEPPPERPISAQRPETSAPADSKGSAAPLPEVLTQSLAQTTLSQLAQRIESCHRQMTEQLPNEIRVSVHTTVRLTIAPDGHVVMGRFEPPLVPEVQGCASAVVAGAKFPHAQRQSRLDLALSF